MADTHPLDEQNAIERKIQLEGPMDPENFRMPDGRTFAQVKNDLETKHTKEFKDDDETNRKRSREVSLREFNKGKSLVMTSAGNVIDTTAPEKKEPTQEEPLPSPNE